MKFLVTFKNGESNVDGSYDCLADLLLDIVDDGDLGTVESIEEVEAEQFGYDANYDVMRPVALVNLRGIGR